ncbi:MAG: nitrate- and nitrite sensing domain-containing protein, partial [Pseudopedobacter sp.]|nr:nitrate- and nitrite sensing domain-containing protein [Deinococcales bacterium]
MMTTAEPSTRPVRDPANPQTPPKSEGGSFLGNFRIGTKLTLATIVLVIPLGVVVGLLANQQNQGVAFAQKERSGVVYLTPLRNFLQELQKHRGSSNGLLNGDASFQKTVTASATAADTALTALEAAPQLAGNAFGLSEDVSTLKTNWQQLRRAVDSRTLSAPQSFQRHTTLVNNILTLIDKVGNRSNLILDPSLDSFYTMNAVVNVLPDLTEFIGQARGNTARISTQNQISSADRVLIQVLVSQAKTLSENLVASYGFAAEANPSVKAQLTAASNSATQNVDTLLALYTREIIQNSGAPRSGTSLFIAATQSLDELFKLHAQTTGVLDRLISDRINTLNRNLIVTLLLVLLGVALAILLVVLVV